MKTVPAALFLLSAVAALSSISQASDDGKSLKDCCLSTSPKEIPFRVVKSYMEQKPGNGCNVHAVVFLTKKNKTLCSPPEEEWVRRLKKSIDKKRRARRLKKRLSSKKKN